MLCEHSDEEGGVKIELDEADGKKVFVTENTQIEIITKALLKEYYDVNFSSGYRVQVALGGIKDKKYGILYPRYCLATLYYNLEGQMFALDFHKNMR